jgi:hypothetical protein
VGTTVSALLSSRGPTVVWAAVREAPRRLTGKNSATPADSPTPPPPCGTLSIGSNQAWHSVLPATLRAPAGLAEAVTPCDLTLHRMSEVINDGLPSHGALLSGPNRPGSQPLPSGRRGDAD